MFEYAALVDAPVKRFTSIVTDAEPDVPVAISQPVARVALGVPQAPVTRPPMKFAPVEPVRVDPELPVNVSDLVARIERIERPGAASRPLARRRDAPRSPSIVPALIGIAAAGMTAFWWIRREPDGRER